MRTTDLSDGTLFEVRPLSRKEIRAGKDIGLRYFGIDDLASRFEDCRDYCLGCLMSEDELDAMANPDQNRLFNDLIKETWGDPGEEKNLPTSGPGAQTESESNTATTAGKTSAKRE